LQSSQEPRVIASAGSEAKLTRAREFGADEIVNYRDRPLADTILDLTDGRGVDLVVEHVGGDLFGDSLRVSRRWPAGHLWRPRW